MRSIFIRDRLGTIRGDEGIELSVTDILKVILGSISYNIIFSIRVPYLFSRQTIHQISDHFKSRKKSTMFTFRSHGSSEHGSPGPKTCAVNTNHGVPRNINKMETMELECEHRELFGATFQSLDVRVRGPRVRYQQ